MSEISSYKKLSSKLWKTQSEKPLGVQSIAVYFYIVSHLKKEDKLEISLSDTAVAKAIGINRNTVKICREKLKNAGLLSFNILGNQPPVYSFPPADLQIELPQPVKISEDNAQQIISKNTSVKTEAETEINDDYPSLETFLEFAKSLEPLDEEMELAVAEKYNFLNGNGWKNAFGKTITNWQQTLKNSLPYLRKDVSQLKLRNIPEISHPKTK